MKRFFTLLIGLIAIVGTVNAYGEIYLRNNISGWDTDDSSYKSEKVWDGSQDVYEFTISETALGNNDFYFRINRYDSDGKLIGPYNHTDYIYKFDDDGYSETYKAPRIDKFQGDNGAFCIKHSEIKAHEYKITIYLKYSDNAVVDDTNYSNIWVYYIKVDIVSMPLTISAGQATFSSDRALNFSGTGVSAYAITGVSNGDLTKSAALTTVPANTGLYITGTNGTYNIPVIKTSGASDIGTNWMIAGTGESVPQTITGYTNYILTNKKADGTTADSPKFFKINSAGNVVPKGKAYLQVPDEYAYAHESLWFGDDETTDIKAIKNGQITIDNNAPIYNLAGQRVANGYKGVVIQNGKKLVIK